MRHLQRLFDYRQEALGDLSIGAGHRPGAVRYTNENHRLHPSVNRPPRVGG